MEILSIPDSIGAAGTKGARPLTVRVRDGNGGVPLATTPVLIQSFTQRVVVERSLDGVTRLVSSAMGVVSVGISYGTEVGIDSLHITVPQTGSTQTLHFAVAPAPLDRVEVPPVVAVVRGGTRSVEIRSYDRFGNRRNDPVTLSGRGRIVVEGDRVTGLDFGSAFLDVRVGGFTRQSRVSVVPDVEIAYAENALLVWSRLDGANRVVLDSLPGSSGGFEPAPDWSPNGRQIVDHGGSLSKLRFVELGSPPRDFASPPVPPARLTFPQWSPDGSLVYFVHDAQGAKQLWNYTRGVASPIPGNIAIQGYHSESPTPSPDGSALVFLRGNVTNCRDLWRLDFGTGQETNLGVCATSARYSPKGDWIAYTGSELGIVRPDGTDRRTIGSDVGYVGPADFTPDGEWVVVSSGGRPWGMHVVRLFDGLVLPLSIDGLYPSVRPPQ